MDLLGTIEPTAGTALGRSEWISLIGVHPALAPVQPVQGKPVHKVASRASALDVNELRSRAEQGDAAAQHELAMAYDAGRLTAATWLMEKRC